MKDDELKSRFTIYKALVADSSSLLESEAFSARLRCCLEKFKNLDTVGLAHYIMSFLLHTRQIKVQFLGRRRLINQIDFRFGSLDLMALRGSASSMKEVNSLAASRLLQVLSETNQKIGKLSTYNADYCGYIAPEITITQPQHRSLLLVLSELEDLHVCTAFGRPNLAGALTAPTWINLLIKVAPRLERLALSQDHPTSFSPTPNPDPPIPEIYYPTSDPCPPNSETYYPTSDTDLSTSETYYPNSDPYPSAICPAGQLSPASAYSPSSPSIHPGKHEDILWRLLWKFFRDEELSLLRFSMTRIAHIKVATPEPRHGSKRCSLGTVHQIVSYVTAMVCIDCTATLVVVDSKRARLRRYSGNSLLRT
ncbi:unnamed protein product [Penicillium egyptiacum]|uniref:Uncharacterized protein n=1 Tax=Penicillium egyptiacum TaxID=1303716 RepID=A0A9W4KM91_9EURO|nr:unnamed protein product [Penicillium egyptiacum]